MVKITLEFEKPLVDLEAKVAELTRQGGMSEKISELNQIIEGMRRDTYQNLTPWQRVQLARHPARAYALDYIDRMFENFLELHGDRRYADDAAVVGGFATLDGAPVMVVGTQKGRDTTENVRRNFGCPHPEGYRKALRLMRLADKAGAPIVSLIDTPGAFPGVASEERHIGEAIAVNLQAMFELSVPFVAVVIGEGGSGGALGIGTGDRVLMLENAYYSVITPEGCAAILWKDRKFAPQAAEALKLSSADLLRLGIVDEVVPEPLGGAHSDHDAAAALLKAAITRNLDELSAIPPEELRRLRYEKYRRMGRHAEKP